MFMFQLPVLQATRTHWLKALPEVGVRGGLEG
jgi:hypothetical protein